MLNIRRIQRATVNHDCGPCGMTIWRGDLYTVVVITLDAATLEHVRLCDRCSPV